MHTVDTGSAFPDDGMGFFVLEAMSMYGNPYVYQSNPFQQPLQLNRVNGIEGARALATRMPPNSQSPAFDGNEDIMYIVTTDSAGYPTIEKYSFTKIDDRPESQLMTNFVTRKEFE